MIKLPSFQETIIIHKWQLQLVLISSQISELKFFPGKIFRPICSLQTDINVDVMASNQPGWIGYHEPWRIPHSTSGAGNFTAFIIDLNPGFGTLGTLVETLMVWECPLVQLYFWYKLVTWPKLKWIIKHEIRPFQTGHSHLELAFSFAKCSKLKMR